MKWKLYKWTKNEFKDVVDKSYTISEALRKLGLPPQGNFSTFHRYRVAYDVDTSHFLGRAHLLGKKLNLPKMPYEEILIKNSLYPPKRLKERLINDGYLDYKCYECGMTDWRNKSITLQIDHINGDRFDHRLENLRMLCPNCHSQTDTWCAKNKKKNIDIPTHRQCSCGAQILYSSNMCRSCSSKSWKRKSKIEWPSNKWLKDRLKNTTCVALGKELGVSDNAIRKHLK